MKRPDTVVLLGPTSAGKTPLGEELERTGLMGRQVVHLDFGRQLRALAAGEWSVAALTAANVDFVRDVLERGALFENETFGIPRAIIDAFVCERGLAEDGLLVLNGLPRHVDQADDIDRLLNVVLVIYLDCAPGTVVERIRLNSGGDRTGRADDSPADVTRKLEIFKARTVPLLDHYHAKGVSIARIDVGIPTTAAEMVRQMETYGSES
jgi:adenylate kinase family enzyme